jgi:PAS domain S-box-containing protein
VEELRYHALLREIGDGYCVVEVVFGPDGKPVDYVWLEANEQFSLHTGLIDPIGRSARELVPDLDAFWFETYGRVALTGETARFEHQAPAMSRCFEVLAYRVDAPELRRVAIFFKDVSGRRQAEENLRESERQWRHLADAMPQLVWTADENGAVNYYNQRSNAYAGFTQSSSGEWRWEPVLHPDDLQLTIDAWQKAVESGQRYTCEHRVRMKDGTFRWHLSRADRFDDLSHRKRWFGTATDIHDLKEAEQNLRLTEERFRLIGKATNDVIWDWDLIKGSLDWNEAAKSNFGWSAEELRSSIENWSDRIHPEDRERVEQGIYRAIEGGAENWADEYRFSRADGTFAVFLDRGYVARDGDGKAIRMIGSMLNMTERRRVEEAISQQRAQLEAVYQSMIDGIMVFDHNGRVLMVNEAQARIAGYTNPSDVPADLTRLIEVFELHLPDGTPVPPEAWPIAQILRGESVMERELRGYRRDTGTTWHFSFSGEPVRDRSGKLVMAVLVTRDITDRVRADEALRQAQQELTRSHAELERQVEERTAQLRVTVGDLEHFSYSITHDMRAPLRAMQGYAELLRSEFEGTLDLPAREYLRRIITASGRMDDLIRDALDYAKVVREELPLQTVDVEELLRGIVDSYSQFQAPHADLSIETGMPHAMANRGGLTQCLSNLLGNAVKFVGPGVVPEVRIWSERRNGNVRFWIQDNGIGISAEDQQRIFVMFQRLSRSHEGTGIGLALVQKVMDKMKGSVGLESEPGQGSRFWIELQSVP